MARTNYAFAKRQRDLAKKKKKEEKRLKKLGTQAEPPAEDAEPLPVAEQPPVGDLPKP